MSYFLICCAKTIAIIVQSEKFLNLQPKHLAEQKRTEKALENSNFLSWVTRFEIKSSY